MYRPFAFFLVLFTFSAQAQMFYGQSDFVWPDKFTEYKPLPDSLKDNDAVILKEELRVNESNLTRRVVVQLLSASGCAAFQKISLPENFDLSNYPNLNRQGRFKGRTNPYIYSYSVMYFASRIIRNKKITDVPLDYSMKKVYWVKNDGERLYDNVVEVNIKNCKPGDILEYTYQLDPINWCRTQDVIYPNGIYPKLNYTLEVNAVGYVPPKTELIYNSRVPPENFNSKSGFNSNYQSNNATYHFTCLQGINYPRHAHPGATLPSISINHRYCNAKGNIGAYAFFNRYGTSLKTMNLAQFDAGAPFYFNYKWALIKDTIRQYIYDSYATSLHRFIKRFPAEPTDTAGILFTNSLVDSLNNFNFLLAETMRNSGKAQYAVPSSHYLEKGSVCEEFMVKNFEDLLAEKRIFFYQGIILDKRFSVVDPAYRNNVRMESKLIVIPHNGNYRYYMPRYRAVSYFPQELPFYYEGTNCAILPCYNCNGNNKVKNIFINATPVSTTEDNERIESVLVKVNMDSLKMSLFIKESLSGQFSTILRHYYAGEAIDSTIEEYYFKKCTDKPGAQGVTIKAGPCSKTFPFRAHYLASENIRLVSPKKINLHNWLSVVMPKEQYATAPNHEFFFDFACSDQYHFMFEFSKPVEIVNEEMLKTTLDNDFFEIKSGITRTEETKYLVNVSYKIKKESIPKSEAAKFREFVNKLDELNNLELILK